MKEQGGLGHWLEERCHREHLSLRQAAATTGLSHGTIRDIIDGSRPLPETIKKLAMGFGGNGKRGLALRDRLFVLAGYRTERSLNEQPYLKIIPLLSPEHQHSLKS
ncbi:unnamed protein product [marine sediment metagenome]|uniref:HTH cro/C1-type domain-containing protein n=1 Tax=marine sediment metagenome TaxID=412755 RepID=X1T210_9ZZZZ